MSTSTVTVTAVDRNEQEDARQVVFNGKGPGHVALFVEERQDWAEYVEDQAALIFDIKVDSAPSKTTYLRLGCGSYCASDIDMTAGMNDYLVGNGWQTLSIDLKCFPTSGENFGVQQPPEEFLTQILRPFTIYTEGELDMSFANVRVEKYKATSALVNCQNQ